MPGHTAADIVVGNPFRDRAPDQVSPSPATPRGTGTNISELRRLVGCWASGFDWRAQKQRISEQRISDMPHRHADIDAVPTYFLRFYGERPGALPLLLTNGWPSTLYEMADVAQRLSAPSRLGRSTDLSFTAIVPSLPGFTFRQRPSLPADLHHREFLDHVLILGGRHLLEVPTAYARHCSSRRPRQGLRQEIPAARARPGHGAAPRSSAGRPRA